MRQEAGGNSHHVELTVALALLGLMVEFSSDGRPLSECLKLHRVASSFSSLFRLSKLHWPRNLCLHILLQRMGAVTRLVSFPLDI